MLDYGVALLLRRARTIGDIEQAAGRQAWVLAQNKAECLHTAATDTASKPLVRYYRARALAAQKRANELASCSRVHLRLS